MRALLLVLVVGVADGRFPGDPLDGAAGDAELLGDLPGAHPGAEQLLDSVAVEHPEHPPWRLPAVGTRVRRERRYGETGWLRCDRV